MEMRNIAEIQNVQGKSCVVEHKLCEDYWAMQYRHRGLVGGVDGESSVEMITYLSSRKEDWVKSFENTDDERWLKAQEVLDISTLGLGIL